MARTISTLSTRSEFGARFPTLKPKLQRATTWSRRRGRAYGSENVRWCRLPCRPLPKPRPQSVTSILQRVCRLISKVSRGHGLKTARRLIHVLTNPLDLG